MSINSRNNKCSNCGEQISANDKFCSQCGVPVNYSKSDSNPSDKGK